MPPAPPRRLATQNQILDAAAALFAEQGLEATSMDDIAAAAEVARGTLYYNFASKERIVLGIALRAFAEIDAALRPRLAAGEPAARLLAELFATAGGWFLAHRPLAHVVLTAPLRGEAPALGFPEDRPSFRLLTRDILTAGQARGEIRTDLDAASLAQIAAGVFTQSVLAGLQIDQPALEEWLRSLVRVLLEGMEARP